MRFIVQFTDNEQHAAKRQQFMQEHLAFLSQHRDTILAAGPITKSSADDVVGGVWMVEAEKEARVQALIEEDPFFSTGLRKTIAILRWQLVFEDGHILS